MNLSGFQVEKFVLKAGAKHCSSLFLGEELDLGSSGRENPGLACSTII